MRQQINKNPISLSLLYWIPPAYKSKGGLEEHKVGQECSAKGETPTITEKVKPGLVLPPEQKALSLIYLDEVTVL